MHHKPATLLKFCLSSSITVMVEEGGILNDDKKFKRSSSKVNSVQITEDIQIYLIYSNRVSFCDFFIYITTEGYGYITIRKKPRGERSIGWLVFVVIRKS